LGGSEKYLLFTADVQNDAPLLLACTCAAVWRMDLKRADFAKIFCPYYKLPIDCCVDGVQSRT